MLFVLVNSSNEVSDFVMASSIFFLASLVFLIASGLTNTIIGQDTASANETTKVATSPIESREDLAKSLADSQSAISNLNDSKIALVKSLEDTELILVDLETTKSLLNSAKGESAASVGICEVACDCVSSRCSCSCDCCPYLGAAKGRDGQIPLAQKAVEDAIKKTKEAKKKIEEAITKSDTSFEELTKTKSMLEKADQSMDKLGKTMAATGKAAGFKDGKLFGILGSNAALGAIAGGLWGGVFGDDPCDQRITGTLMDYMINLKQDALPISVDQELISGWWNSDDAKVFGVYDSQEVGVYFENMGLEESDGIYGIVNLPATRHYHANPTMISEGNSGFGPFNVPDQSAEQYTQRFHLKFVTSPSTSKVELLPQQTYSCLQGSLFGETGAEALPDIKLNWGWSEPSGIAMDSCDYYNDDGIYCDSTQFRHCFNKENAGIKRIPFSKPADDLPYKSGNNSS